MTHPLRVAENCTTQPLHTAQNLMTHPLSAPATPPFLNSPLSHSNASVNSSYAQVPPGYCGAFARLVSPGDGAFANFALPGGRAFANPWALPKLLIYTRFPIRI